MYLINSENSETSHHPTDPKNNMQADAWLTRCFMSSQQYCSYVDPSP